MDFVMPINRRVDMAPGADCGGAAVARGQPTIRPPVVRDSRTNERASTKGDVGLNAAAERPPVGGNTLAGTGGGALDLMGAVPVAEGEQDNFLARQVGITAAGGNARIGDPNGHIRAARVVPMYVAWHRRVIDGCPYATEFEFHPEIEIDLFAAKLPV